VKPRVLLLDDEPVIVDTLAIILNQHGYEARAVYTHDAAIETARSFTPEAFYTGVINVGKNGCETAVELLSILPDCKILVSTGSLGGIEIFK
jgi:DNA-binding response OmpR family regulator